MSPGRSRHCEPLAPGEVRNCRRRTSGRGVDTPRKDRLRVPANLLLLSTADTDLLAAAEADAGWTVANPARLDLDGLAPLLAAAEVVVVRLLGGRRAWEEGLDAVIASGKPAVVVSGEAAPDAELMSLSTVPAGAVTEALAYLREGGSENLRNLAGFLRDTLLLTGDEFEPPRALPAYGVPRDVRRGRPAGGRDRLLPRARDLREHRLRRHAGRRRRGGGCAAAARVLRDPARTGSDVVRERRTVRPAAQVRRPGHDPARRRRIRRGQRERRRFRRRLGRRGARLARHPADPGPRADVDPRAVAGQ